MFEHCCLAHVCFSFPAHACNHGRSGAASGSATEPARAARQYVKPTHPPIVPINENGIAIISKVVQLKAAATGSFAIASLHVGHASAALTGSSSDTERNPTQAGPKHKFETTDEHG
jgi:hypothetical protein